MQPNQPTPEQGQPRPAPEQVPGEVRPETAPAPQERQAPRGDQAAQGDATFTSIPLPQPVQVPQEEQQQGKTDDTGDTKGPAIADDVDLIEREWVDKAKQIVNEHKHDPYNQEKEVDRLRTDYRQKRYGKTTERDQ